MLPLVTKCHTHLHLHQFHFVLFKVKNLVAKQHPTHTHTHAHTHTRTHARTHAHTFRAQKIWNFPHPQLKHVWTHHGTTTPTGQKHTSCDSHVTIASMVYSAGESTSRMVGGLIPRILPRTELVSLKRTLFPHYCKL